MIFNRVLSAASDDCNIPYSRLNRLLDHVLDQRLVDQWKHFLGLGFSSREKPRAETGSREHGFSNSHHHLTIVPKRNQRVLVKKCCATER